MTSRIRSPAPGGSGSAVSRSAQPSPRPKFDNDLLRTYIRKLLASTLQGQAWDFRDKETAKTWGKQIGERIRDRMIEIQPRGFKYIVTCIINENLGQGGRANMVCHWEDTDTVAQEMFANDSIICVCLAFAVQTT